MRTGLWMFLSGAIAAVAFACSSSTSRDGFENPAGPRLDASAPAVTDAAPVDIDAGPVNLDDVPVTCDGSGARCAVELVRGDHHFCTRMSDGTVRCWGSDTSLRGVLGSGTAIGALAVAPTAVPGLTDVKQLSAAGNTTCALRGNGEVWCWGDNTLGQLGLPPPVTSPPTTDALIDSDAHPVPARPTVPAAARVDVGAQGVCAKLQSGAVWCWGDELYGKLQRPGDVLEVPANYNDPPSPRSLVPGLSSFPAAGVDLRELGSSSDAAFAVTKDGHLYSWGYYAGLSFTGTLGRAASERYAPPAVIDVGGAVIDLDARADTIGHACAVRVDVGRAATAPTGSSLICWGINYRGELGNGGTSFTGTRFAQQTSVFRDVASGAFPQRVSVQPEATCVRLTDGSVACAGSNDRGRLGDAAVLSRGSMPSFGRVQNIDTAVSVAVSGTASCALLAAGGVVCWGGNGDGELGLGKADEDPHPDPVKVVFP